MKGFTLLEVLVALSIFAMIGIGTNQLLRTVIDTRDATESRTSHLIDTERAIGILERDLSQLVDRSIRNEYGDRVSALLIGYGMYELEFSRLGWRNPTAAPRSSVQRVAYRMKDGELERCYWTILDRTEDSEPRVQKILSDIEDFRVLAVNENGDKTDHWTGNLSAGNAIDQELSLADDDAEGQRLLPAALEVFIRTKELGEIRKLINLVEEADLTQPEENGLGGEADQDQAGTKDSTRGKRNRRKKVVDEDE